MDPDDDSVDRWIVWHHQYDEHRRQRRNLAVAAYDDAAEFEERFRLEREQLSARQSAGEAESVEHISGSCKRAGHDAAMRQQRIHPLSRPAWERKR